MSTYSDLLEQFQNNHFTFSQSVSRMMLEQIVYLEKENARLMTENEEWSKKYSGSWVTPKAVGHHE